MTATASTWTPTKVLVADLEEGLGDVSLVAPDGLVFGEAWVVIRRGGTATGMVTIDLQEGLAVADIEARVRAELARRAAGVQLGEPPADVQRSSRPDCQLPAFTVVVCSTFERFAELCACVVSVFGCDYPRVEVLVVDNRPAADLEQHQALRSLAPDVRIVHEGGRGLSVARNRGLSMCTTELIAYTDDDIHVDRHWLRSLGSTFLDVPQACCVTGLVLPNDLTTEAQHLFEAFYGGFNRTFELTTYGPGKPKPDQLYPYAAGRFGTGANMAFRTAALRDLGGFDDALGAGTLAKGGEDLAIFASVVLAGGTLVVQPSAITSHRHRTTRKELLSRVQSYGSGLTAMLTALIVQEPRHAARIAWRVPPALRLLVRSRSGTVARRDVGIRIPRQLYLRQALGMALGPMSYFRSRRDIRRRQGGDAR